MSSVADKVAALVYPIPAARRNAPLDVGQLTVLPGLLEVPDTVLVVCGRAGIDTEPVVRDLLGGVHHDYLRGPARFHFAAEAGPTDDLRLPGASTTMADVGLPHPWLRDGLVVINLPDVTVASPDSRAVIGQADVVVVVLPAEPVLTAADAELIQWVADRVAEPPIIVVGSWPSGRASRATSAIRQQVAPIVGEARSLVLDGVGAVKQVVTDAAERRRSTRFATGLTSSMSLARATSDNLAVKMRAFEQDFERERDLVHEQLATLHARVDECEQSIVAGIALLSMALRRSVSRQFAAAWSEFVAAHLPEDRPIPGASDLAAAIESSFDAVLRSLNADAAVGLEQIVADAERSLESSGDAPVRERVLAATASPFADLRMMGVPGPPDTGASSSAGVFAGAAAGAAAGSILPIVGTLIGGVLGIAAGVWFGKAARRRRRDAVVLKLAEFWNAQVDLVDRHIRDRLDDIAGMLRADIRRYGDSSAELTLRGLESTELVDSLTFVGVVTEQLQRIEAELVTSRDESRERLALAQPLPELEVIPVLGGDLIRYVLGSNGFVLLDAAADGTVVSWSGTCTPADFLSLCSGLAAGEPEAYGIVTIQGDRIAGPSAEVLDAAEGRIDHCDFIRWDLPEIDIAFHRLSRDDGASPSVVISAVGADYFGLELRLVARETTRPEVAAAVFDVAPQRWIPPLPSLERTSV